MSPTTSGASRACRRWIVPALISLLGTGAAYGITPACGPNFPTQLVRLDRHAAKKLLLRETKPSYPSLAKLNYIRGRVQLVATVDCQGRVTDIHVIRGHPFLAAAALKAIHRWIYRPFETGAGPAAFQTLITVNFSLIGQNFKVQNLPPEADKFLARGVSPPRLVSDQLTKIASGNNVRLRVLVSNKGHVVDSTLLSGSDEELAAARRIVARWKFHPAQWGHLDVPWYTEVSVPVQQVRRKQMESDTHHSSGVTPRF
ncbi:MAG TPA: TonB family protein [Terriglobia bacterium]|nr:TonB family protein [Terriglobia bacterium]